MTRQIRRLVAEMCLGMFLYVLVLGVLAALFRKGLSQMGFALGPVLCGLFAGFIADVAMLVHMAVVAERATDSRDAAYANRFTVVQSMLRKVIFVAAIFLLGSRPQIDAVAMIIGALGLKAGAFLQPSVHRFCTRGKETEEDSSAGSQLREDEDISQDGGQLREEGDISRDSGQLQEDGDISPDTSQLPEDGDISRDSGQARKDGDISRDGGQLPEDANASPDASQNPRFRPAGPAE